MFFICSSMSGRSLEESTDSSIAKYKWMKAKNSFKVPALFSEVSRAFSDWPSVLSFTVVDVMV